MIDLVAQANCRRLRELAGVMRDLVKDLRGKVDSVELDEASVHLLEFTAGINRAEFLPPTPVVSVFGELVDRKRLAANDIDLDEGRAA
jgi:hypothetical protein